MKVVKTYEAPTRHDTDTYDYTKIHNFVSCPVYMSTPVLHKLNSIIVKIMR
jgi:hypothetical protein